MLLNWIVATDISEVGVSLFDFYSIGHICFGLGTFLFFSLLYTIPMQFDKKPLLPLWAIFLLTMGVLIAWEFLENFLFIEIGIKFEDRLDSPGNITTDLILGAFGALINWIAAYEIEEKHEGKGIKWYYLTGIIAFALWLILFVILRYITYWATAIY